MNAKILYMALFLIASATLLQAQKNKATDEESIQNLLDEFLSKVAEEEMHDRFWSENLTYTSSSGERFGKSTIMKGFDDDSSDDSKSPLTEYSANDVKINVFGKTATLTFKLVAQVVDADTTETVYYYNSGVLKKEKRNWEVIVWQATKIPKE